VETITERPSFAVINTSQNENHQMLKLTAAPAGSHEINVTVRLLFTPPKSNHLLRQSINQSINHWFNNTGDKPQQLNKNNRQQVAQLSLTNPRDALHHDKWQNFKNSHVTITTPFCC